MKCKIYRDFRSVMKNNQEIYMRLNYKQIYTRMPPYLLGILLGYFLYQNKKRSFKISINQVRNLMLKY